MAGRLAGLLAAVMITGVAVLYLAIIHSQESPHGDDGRVALFAGVMGLAALLAVGGSFAVDPYWRRLLFGIAAAVTLVLGILGALSIGMLFLPPLLLLAFAFGRA